MPASPQLLATDRLTYWLTLIFVWTACTWGLLLSTDYSFGWREILMDAAVGSPMVAWFVLSGAAAAGAIALLVGWRLSRHYCWIFGMALGAWLAPLAMVVLIFAAGSAAIGNLFARFAGPSGRLYLILYIAGLIGSIVAGLVLGVLLARRSLGFAAQATRSARLGAGIGALAAAALILWARFRDDPWTSLEGSLQTKIMLGAGVVFASAVIPALCNVERPEPIGFQVLPVAEPSAAKPTTNNSMPQP